MGITINRNTFTMVNRGLLASALALMLTGGAFASEFNMKTSFSDPEVSADGRHCARTPLRACVKELEEKARFQQMTQGPALEGLKGMVDQALLDKLLVAAKAAEANL